MKGVYGLVGVVLSAAMAMAGQYKVLSPVSEGNLTVFPVIAGSGGETKMFLTLDEGIRSGEVVVTEMGRDTGGLVRPRPEVNDGVLRDRPLPPPRQQSAQVNELWLVNRSERPLLLLAGEIVTGGKQDRIVGKDRIIPAHSEPVALGVFCVEPHRWTERTAKFDSYGAVMAQPSVRAKALFEQNQQGVWDQVAKSRQAMIAGLRAQDAAPVPASSSYAEAVKAGAVKGQIEDVAKPIQQSFDGVIRKLREQNAVGAVVALNGEIIWADVFASADLLNRYWPKLIRSYAAESFGSGRGVTGKLLGTERAQEFLEEMDGHRETVETEPGVYRQTEIHGDGFTAFVLTSLLPGTGYRVHVAKMRE